MIFVNAMDNDYTLFFFAFLIPYTLSTPRYV